MAKRNNKNKISLCDKLIKNKKERFDNQYVIAPKGLLLQALTQYYSPKSKDVIDNLEKFSKHLLNQLSLLASNDKETSLFGDDFNEFFKLIIKTINRCAKLEKTIEEHGIEVDDDDEDKQ